MENLDEWNQFIKDYLFDTDNIDKTKTDVLVQQIIDAYETDNDDEYKMDYDSLYDLEMDELIRIVEREFNDMTARTIIKERKHENKKSRSEG